MPNETPPSADVVASSPPSTPTPPAGPPPGVPAPPVAYPLSEKTLLDIDNRFSYHGPKGDQTARYAQIRAKARELALAIVGNTPLSREQALALTHLDEVMMFANAAIARNE